MTATAVPRSTGHTIGHYERTPTYVVDLRDARPDQFDDVSATDWSRLAWSQTGRPYTVERWAQGKRMWEAEHGRMSVQHGWSFFNQNFHKLFMTDVPASQARVRGELLHAMSHADVHGAREAIGELVQLLVWNKVQRVEDAIWDPRGKRALFAGLDVKRPRILFLGAADGYEAMQLYAQYPGGEVVLVDYDEFCKTERFGRFPEAYPFLGVDDSTCHPRVWYREEMPIAFEVKDIRDLDYSAQFDVVVSIGLIEHFPDEHKAEAFALHRRFVKPGGWVVLTTPRNQWRTRVFYTVMSDLLNYGYRELMDVWQMGLYAYENGLDIRRAGVIKAHNGLICKVR
jgi:hypothetical protein